MAIPRQGLFSALGTTATKSPLPQTSPLNIPILGAKGTPAQQAGLVSTQRPTQLFSQLGTQLATGLGQAAPGLLQGGLGSLLQIIGSQGQTDPTKFNQMLAQASRGGQAASQNVQSNLARAGLLGSGVGQAFGAAIDSAGSNKVASLRAEELQKSEQRKRDDLQLLLSMFFDPALSLTGVGIQGEEARSQRKSSEKSALISAFAQLAGGAGVAARGGV